MKNEYLFNKVFLFVSAILFITSTNVSAQVSSYIFSQSMGTYSAITPSTILGNTQNDDEVFNNNTAGQLPPAISTGFPIGFNFIYHDTTFTNFAVSSNGWIRLGKGTFQMGDSAFFETPISTPSSSFSNAISSFGVDLEAQGGASLGFQTIGTSPNRILIVQWKKYGVFGTNGYDLNFQTRLYETSNKIDFIYGSMVSPSNGESAEVGLSGTTNVDFNNREDTTSWVTTSPGTSNDATIEFDLGIEPPSGLTYTWTPFVPTGIKELDQTFFNIYPNPSNGIFNLSINQATSEQVKIKVLSITGSVIYENENFSNNNIELNLKENKPGLYLVLVIKNGESFSKKIILQ